MRPRPQSIWVPFALPPLRTEANLKRARSMQRPFPPDCLPKLREQVIKSRSKWQIQRALCLLLRAQYHLPSWQIAELIGWNLESVRRMQRRYLHEGDAVFHTPGRGGRRKELLSIHQERRLLRSLRREIWPLETVDVAALRKAYEKAVGHAVTPSTVYRMLARHGWRKDPVVKVPATRARLRNTSAFTKRISPVNRIWTPIDYWILDQELADEEWSDAELSIDDLD
jgi:transposase